MSNMAFIFPGQASQFVGMARDLFESSERVRSLFETAAEILGFDLADVCFNGPLDKLTRTEHTQPAVLVHSLAVLTLMEDMKFIPRFCAGHSLGEYSALACAGAVTFEDAIAAVRDRSRLMKAACDSTDGTMTAAIGGDGDSIEKLVADASAHGVLQPANFNSPGQVVLSGDRKGVSFAQEDYKSYGFKRMLPLKVGGAFHSPLMRHAADRMANTLSEIKFVSAKCPVVANVTAEPVESPDEIRDLLVRQITSPVKWMQSVEKMYELGVRRFVEIGPGKVLAGLVKKTLSDVGIDNIGTVEELERFMQTTEVA
ncbi:MAG: ACP S-malonyltransferase [candidate division Zixibacteria bacterium]|nr:ACP S-malonyltransferase [candidate division Zixibacteria bacterium]